MVQQIKDQIVKSALQIENQNPFFKRASEGILTENSFVEYLNSIWYLVSHTAPCLRLAAKESLRRGDKNLAKFFSDKIAEEEGHEKWAEEDLSHVGSKTDPKKVTPEMLEMIEAIKSLILKDPRYYVAYILFNEYFLVLLAPNFLQNLKTKCGFSEKYFSVISNHQGLDVHHVEDDLKCIEDFFTPAELNEISACLSEFSNRFDGLFRKWASVQ